MPKRRKKANRRRHHHYQTKIFYADGEVFARVYTERERAEAFAERQRKSPVVKMVRVSEVDKQH